MEINYMKLLVLIFLVAMSRLVYSQELSENAANNISPVDIILIRDVLSGKSFATEGYLHTADGKVFLVPFNGDIVRKIELIYPINLKYEDIKSGAKYKVILRLNKNDKALVEIVFFERLDVFHGELVVNSIVDVIDLTQEIIFNKSDPVDFHDRIRLNLLTQYGFSKTHYPKLFALANTRLAEIKSVRDPFQPDPENPK